MKSASKLRPVPVLPEVESARPSRTPKAPRELGVVERVKLAFKRGHRLAACCALVLGGFVPLASWVLAHFELDRANAGTLHLQLSAYIVLGGLLFSAKTVYDFGRQAFDSAPKALGFVVLLEGILIASETFWLSVAALVLLVAVNGVGTACNLIKKA